MPTPRRDDSVTNTSPPWSRQRPTRPSSWVSVALRPSPSRRSLAHQVLMDRRRRHLLRVHGSRSSRYHLRRICRGRASTTVWSRRRRRRNPQLAIIIAATPRSNRATRAPGLELLHPAPSPQPKRSRRLAQHPWARLHRASRALLPGLPAPLALRHSSRVSPCCLPAPTRSRGRLQPPRATVTILVRSRRALMRLRRAEALGMAPYPCSFSPPPRSMVAAPTRPPRRQPLASMAVRRAVLARRAAMVCSGTESSSIHSRADLLHLLPSGSNSSCSQ